MVLLCWWCTCAASPSRLIASNTCQNVRILRQVQGHLIQECTLGSQFEVTGSMQEVTSMLIDKVMGDRHNLGECNLRTEFKSTERKDKSFS